MLRHKLRGAVRRLAIFTMAGALGLFAVPVVVFGPPR